ncbi:MAG: polyphosphate polymerase domain-containing protein [Lachnospiraceae bacterium]|nr:polyphosphate polymerase domain-containing protein [Lachnospiraceae bacterium]
MKRRFRHEYKYLCNSLQNAVLKMRVKGLLTVDRHAEKEGYYFIRSLYFDTLENRCYEEIEAGCDRRDKYRIRIYNANSERIMLEKKSKECQMTSKKSCPISEEICRKLMENQRIEITEDMPAIQKELLLEMQLKGMRPTVIVEYQRFPYIEKNGNVRVTFDENIRSSNEISCFLDEKIVTRPILEMGQSILEVKWDAFLPSYIMEHMGMENLQWSSFSKYYLCRKYNTSGGIRI